MKTGEGIGKRSEEKQSRKEKTQAVEAGIAGEQIHEPRIFDAKSGVEYDPREYDSHQREILDPSSRLSGALAAAKFPGGSRGNKHTTCAAGSGGKFARATTAHHCVPGKAHAPSGDQFAMVGQTP